MNEIEEQKLKAALANGIVLWCPDESTARQVVSVTARKDEPSLCANFSNGEYAALYNCPIADFVLGTRLN